MDNAEKFEQWIRQPLESLRAVPDGGGAFAAITIIMAVLNGLVKAAYLKSIGDKKSLDGSLPSSAMLADFLQTDEASVSGWRHAMGAQSWRIFMIPKECLRISHQYGELPVLSEDGRWEVDPWKFADLVLRKVDENMDLIYQGYFPLMRAYIEKDEYKAEVDIEQENE
jgi:hypothetical protein